MSRQSPWDVHLSWRDRRLWAVLLCTIAAGLVLRHFVAGPEPLDRGARRVLHAMGRLDSDSAFDYLLPEEQQALGLGMESFRRLLTDYLGSRLKGFEPTGEPRYIPMPRQDMLTVIQPYRHRDGRRTEITVTMARTEDGVKAIDLGYSIVLAGIPGQWPADKPYPRGREKIRFMRDSIALARPELEQIGMRGVVTRSTVDNPDGRFLRWEELVESFDERLERSAPGPESDRAAVR